MDLENKIFLRESPKKNRKLKRIILKSKLLQSKLFGQKKTKLIIVPKNDSGRMSTNI